VSCKGEEEVRYRFGSSLFHNQRSPQQGQNVFRFARVASSVFFPVSYIRKIYDTWKIKGTHGSESMLFGWIHGWMAQTIVSRRAVTSSTENSNQEYKGDGTIHGNFRGREIRARATRCRKTGYGISNTRFPARPSVLPSILVVHVVPTNLRFPVLCFFVHSLDSIWSWGISHQTQGL